MTSPAPLTTRTRIVFALALVMLAFGGFLLATRYNVMGWAILAVAPWVLIYAAEKTLREMEIDDD